MTSVTFLMVDLMAGANSSGSNSGVGRAMKKEDFALTKGDVLTEMVEGVPSITFSNRMQEFQDENDYNKALIGGLWVIFGRYLIVRPWSLEFSTSQSGIESQAVWIRLPRLPKGYYSDCLLRVIGVKTTSPAADFNRASPVMKKSGLKQRVENKPFSPWMVVEQWKGRSRVIGKERNDSSGGAFGGSWFATLGDLKGENLGDVDGKIDDKMEDRN
ncbi:hypothetical protein PVK06_031859 [Gossypium arboreum]|uniref:DUF4283 domain-containing protein n=1 Tax=Gossypium arboreum TaxID=29729 RepID=A0ABR0NSF5_GOSAR|nr:hypothetical protein PVK06_031859 [Gossypium arboreum]